MKIWIISSGYEMMPLMKFLNKTNHEVHFFIDWKYWPWWDKSDNVRIERIQKWIEYLSQQWVKHFIVPPFAESLCISNWEIIPLFKKYLLDYVSRFSIVWKFWVLCEQTDMSNNTEELLLQMMWEYKLSDNQLNTKKFNTSYPMWKKNVRMRSYFITTYGSRDSMLRKTLKHDLRYFTDAWIDTLIPMSRWFLFYQKIIKTRFNWKKMRFHGLDAVEDCFKTIISDEVSWEYSLTLHYTDTPKPLLEEQKWMRILTKWDKINVHQNLITIS